MLVAQICLSAELGYASGWFRPCLSSGAGATSAGWVFQACFGSASRNDSSGTPLQLPFFALRGLPERFEPVKPLPVPAYGSARDYARWPSASGVSAAPVAASVSTPAASHGSLLQVPSSSPHPGVKPASGRPRFGPGSPAGVVLQSEIHEKRWKKIFFLWQDLELQLVPHSSLLQGLPTSRFRDFLRERLLMRCQDTTVLRYFGSISRFLLAASDLDFSISSITQLQVVDVMFSLAASGDDDSAPDTLELPHNMLKALRWMVNTFALDNFPSLVGPLFASVLAFSAKDRCEAPPLALDFVWYLEQLVLRCGTPAVDRIWAGSFLVCVWSSLRFSDAQHVLWSSLNAASSASVLRGILYRTKGRLSPWVVAVCPPARVAFLGYRPGFMVCNRYGTAFALLTLQVSRIAFSSDVIWLPGLSNLCPTLSACAYFGPS